MFSKNIDLISSCFTNPTSLDYQQLYPPRISYSVNEELKCDLMPFIFVQKLIKTVLLVVASPKITGLPKLLTKLEGSTVSLRCFAKGFPYIDYKWIKQEPSKRLKRMVGGASLVLTNVTEKDEGVYTCFASNTVGNTSFDVRINVHSEYYPRPCSDLFKDFVCPLCSNNDIAKEIADRAC